MKSYSYETHPGLSDCYWYEWSMGLNYILDMLNPDNNIISVIFQYRDNLGLDDVVVKYSDNSIRLLQIKHTRADDSLTFGDMIENEKDEDASGISLLRKMAKAWLIDAKKYNVAIPMLFTNRKIGIIPSKAKLTENDKYSRPPLNIFFAQLKQKITQACSLSEIKIVHNKIDYSQAWNIWCSELSDIPTEEEKIEFLKLLEITPNQKGLDEIENELINKLSNIFSIAKNQAHSLLSSLDSALRIWTSSRGGFEVKIADVYEVLCLEKTHKQINHFLRPPIPFFQSRKDFINILRNEIENGTERILFLQGVPGIGKTSIVSEIANHRETAIDIRYFAHEPIKIDSEYSEADTSIRVNPNIFWDELIVQLKSKIRGKLLHYKAPIRCDFLSVDEKKKEFIRIASQLAQDRGKPFVVAIDGIDHAARAGASVETFLNTLIPPDYIPNTIKFFISGQPIESNPQYPVWFNNNKIKICDVPLISMSDIKLLIDSTSEMQIPNQHYDILAKVIYEASNGNTLSALFAIYESKMCKCIADVKLK